MRTLFYVLTWMIFTLLCSATAVAQGKPTQQKPNPVQTKVSNKALVTAVYPEAAKVEKVNDYWFRVLDAKGTTIGFAMNGEPFCREEKGYNGPTPLLVITDTKGIIRKVDLLSHYETAGYVKQLHRKGFFDAWNGQSLEAARTLKVDACTGATVTSKAVLKNMQYLLNNGSKQFPKK